MGGELHFGRRTVLGGLAALPLLGGKALAAPPARPIVASIALEDRRVWVGVTISGRPPVLFIVDTGTGISKIQPSYARTLGLRKRGVTRLIGMGGEQGFDLVQAEDVVFGGAIRQPFVAFAQPDEDLRLPREAMGLLAAGLLTSVDSELDFDAGEWRVYPSGRGPRDGFTAVPSRITAQQGSKGSEVILVDAVLDGRTYRLLADTGAPGQIHLFDHATRSSGLWNNERPYVPIQQGGIGGLAKPGRLARAGKVALGGIAFERPLVSLSQEARRHPLAEGVIGLELLQLLTLSTDVRGGRLWVKRNARAAPPERHGMSGLWLEEQGGKVVVADVSPASPAAEAGLAVGDELLGGRLGDFIRRLAAGPGAQVPLRVRRGAAERDATVTLRPYL
ncbi:MAG TPA: aspartyl protease family protein [Allosphingosinicella sp.]|jgi:serine protease Do